MNKDQYLKTILAKMIVLEDCLFQLYVSILNGSDLFDDSINELIAEKYPFQYSLDDMTVEVKKWILQFKTNINK